MRACWPAMVAAACALAPLIATAGEPTVVRDGLDRVVTLPAPPQRIVTIFASNTEMVAALGLTDSIVGIEAYTRYPPEVVSKPLVGGRLGFSVDAVVGLRPDLVVVTPARQAVNQLLDPMERLGIPVLVLLQRSVPQIFLTGTDCRNRALLATHLRKEHVMLAGDIAERRLKILVEQYVEARKKNHDFVSTELASKAIRQFISPPIGEKALDNMIAKCAVEHGLIIRFDRK